MPEDTNHINEDLIIKYLLKETDFEESRIVEAWLHADMNNQKTFNDYQTIWEESGRLAQLTAADEHLAWQRMQQRWQANHADEAVVRKMQRWHLTRIAAIWVFLIAGAALIGYYLNDKRKVEILAVKAGNEILIDTLPDGSIVTLNKYALISYPEEFKGGTREIKLTGEAFFNVAADKTKPFIITTGDVIISVVGTSFNVKTYQGNIEVVVETGVVDVSRKRHNLRLKPKERAVVKPKDTTIVKEAVEDKLYNYYASKEFVCVNTPLWKLVAILNEAYGVQIQIKNEQLRRQQLTTTFNNESLDKILLVISETFNISVEREADIIILQ